MPLQFPDVKDIIELDPQQLTKFAEDSAKQFALNKITTNQIRNLYSEIVKIKTQFQKKKDPSFSEIRKEFILLKPKLAYMTARNKDLKPMKNIFEKFVDMVDESQNKNKALELFFDFSEAVVAYHKFYAPK
jgi:CRISPR-associated protein Csm2